MANKFSITITAVDKATAIVKKINRSTASITRPISNIGKSIVTMGKEVKRNPIIQFTEKIGKTALGAAESIGKFISPFSALLGGAASVGGIVALADAWGKSGIALEYASRRTGMAVGKLQELRGAATAAGISADVMQSALVGLGTTLQNADFMRNPKAWGVMRTFGIQIKRNKAGVIDTTRMIDDIADTISKIKDPNVQAEVANTFGLGEILPMLQEGKKALQEHRAEAKKAGAVNEKGTAANAALGNSFNKLKLEIEGASLALSAKYSPALTKAIDATTGFLQSSKTQSTFSLMGDQVGSLFTPIVGGIQYLESLGDDSTTSRARRTATGKIKFKSSIPGANGAAGAPGANGAAREPMGIRNNNPMNLQPGGKESTFPTADAGIYAGARNLIKNYQGLTLAQIAHKYTPDGAPGNKPGTEVAWAASVAKSTGMKTSDTPDLSNAKTLAPLLSAIIRQENGKNPYSKGQLEAAAQKITVEVHVKGNTQGVTATARSDGGGTNVPTPRVFYPMPTGAES